MLLLRFWCKEHQHIASFQFGGFFNVCEFSAGIRKLPHDLIAKLRMAHLTAAKTNGYLYLIPFAYKPLGVSQLGIKIMGINVERKTDFLDLHHALIFSSFFFPLGLFKTELAVIDDLAHRRLCLGRNFYQIQIAGIGLF